MTVSYRPAFPKNEGDENRREEDGFAGPFRVNKL